MRENLKEGGTLVHEISERDSPPTFKEDEETE